MRDARSRRIASPDRPLWGRPSVVAFRSTDTSGRASGLLLRCVLYCLLALGLIIVDKRYDHLGRIRRFLSVIAYPVQVAVASPFEGWNWFRESCSPPATAICARITPGCKPSCASRSSSCSATRPWKPRVSGCAPCATIPPGSPIGSSSATSWMSISMRFASGSWSTRARATGCSSGRRCSIRAGCSGKSPGSRSSRARSSW